MSIKYNSEYCFAAAMFHILPQLLMLTTISNVMMPYSEYDLQLLQNEQPQHDPKSQKFPSPRPRRKWSKCTRIIGRRVEMTCEGCPRSSNLYLLQMTYSKNFWTVKSKASLISAQRQWIFVNKKKHSKQYLMCHLGFMNHGCCELVRLLHPLSAFFGHVAFPHAHCGRGSEWVRESKTNNWLTS